MRPLGEISNQAPFSISVKSLPGAETVALKHETYMGVPRSSSRVVYSSSTNRNPRFVVHFSALPGKNPNAALDSGWSRSEDRSQPASNREQSVNSGLTPS